jgi:hypothetical protein
VCAEITIMWPGCKTFRINLPRKAKAGQSPKASRITHNGVEIEKVVTSLTKLAGLLTARGLRARLHQPIGRPPSLHVINPGAPSLEEHIILDRCEQGELWFLWPWDERIAEATEIGNAADSISVALLNFNHQGSSRTGAHRLTRGARGLTPVV